KSRSCGGDRHGAPLILRIARCVDRPEDAITNAGTGDGDAMSHHEHHPVLAESARERGTLLRLDHKHVGVAEFLTLVPERRTYAADRAEMEDRHIIRAGGKERHEGRTMVMAHRIHIGPRLVDFAVDHPFRILSDAWVAHRL